MENLDTRPVWGTFLLDEEDDKIFMSSHIIVDRVAVLDNGWLWSLLDNEILHSLYLDLSHQTPITIRV
jgi:hypothetical protein